MAEWVDLRPIFDVVARNTGYKGGGKIQVQLLRHAAAENQMNFTVEDILMATRARQQREYGRRGKSKGGSEGGAQT